MDIDPVFHVCLLNSVVKDALKGHIPFKNFYVIVNGQKKYEIKKFWTRKNQKTQT